MYTIPMRRTSLELDENLLEEAMQVLGLKTYSATVNHALAEVVRVRKIRSLPSISGSRFWEGNLAATREDHLLPERRRARGLRGLR
jgi:Arc/MetJ family transcription regulator